MNAQLLLEIAIFRKGTLFFVKDATELTILTEQHILYDKDSEYVMPNIHSWQKRYTHYLRLTTS